MFDANWSTAGNRWDVLRLRGGSQTEFVLLSRSFFALSTHWSRRTFPCAGEACAVCELLPARGLFYLAGFVNGRVYVAEMGAMSASHLEQHAKLLHGGLVPGLVFRLKRQGDKRPIHSEVIRSQQVGGEVSTLQLAAHVMALYKFPPPNPGCSIEDYETRCREIAIRRNELEAATLRASSKPGVAGRA